MHVQKGNDAALEFYLKNQFVVVEELKDYYTDLQPADAVLLERQIAE